MVYYLLFHEWSRLNVRIEKVSRNKALHSQGNYGIENQIVAKHYRFLVKASAKMSSILFYFWVKLKIPYVLLRCDCDCRPLLKVVHLKKSSLIIAFT
jgi:hypothetical protein